MYYDLVSVCYEYEKWSILFENVLIGSLLHLKPPREDFLMRELKVSSHSVVDWYSFPREVFIESMINSFMVLGGPGTTIEIDKAKFGKRKFNRGRIVNEIWVFRGMRRDTGETFFQPVTARNTVTLLDVIKNWVQPGTTIISDCLRAYNCLNEEGFQHLTINHSMNFIDPETGAHTQTIERTWRDIRSTIPKYGVWEEHFDGYLAQYQFKWKHPNHFHRLHYFFIAAVQLYKPEY